MTILLVLSLQGSISGLSLLRLADSYNVIAGTVTMADGEVNTVQSLQYIGGDDLAACVFQLSTSLAELNTDNIEFALLSAIYLYSGNDKV